MSSIVNRSINLPQPIPRPKTSSKDKGDPLCMSEYSKEISKPKSSEIKGDTDENGNYSDLSRIIGDLRFFEMSQKQLVQHEQEKAQKLKSEVKNLQG